MSLEGHLRDLALSEVLQLLAIGKKSGVLRISSPLEAREASIAVDNGWVTAVTFGGIEGGSRADVPSIEEAVLSVLDWRDGSFHFKANESVVDTAGIRVSVDMLLVESARRFDAWNQLAPHVKDTNTVPSFPDVEPKELPLLHLEPDQWEILTVVDGTRTVAAIAEALDKDVIEVAGTIFRLVEAGVLITHAEPLPAHSYDAIDIPPVYLPETSIAEDDDELAEDSLFDPMQVGVMTPDGMPVMSADPEYVSSVARSVPTSDGGELQLTTSPETSSYEADAPTDAERLLHAGDIAARTGNFAAACELWQQCLLLAATAGVPIEAVHERIEYAKRLHLLLNS